jgi:glycine cleavage system H protein
MSNSYPKELRYTDDHEWVADGGGTCRCGITQFAVDQLGDITLVDLPKVGDSVTKGARFGTVESVKSVSDLFAPVTGKVTAVNAALKDSPELVNQDPYQQGWMIDVAPSSRGELDQLMSADAYQKHTAEH